MKYLKTFEDSILDNILDKVSKYGIDSLTPGEDKLLKNYYKGDSEELEKVLKYKKDRIKNAFEYDPRDDAMFFKKLSDDTGINFDFTEFSDEEIEAGKWQIAWDELEDEDIRHFMKLYNIEDAEKPYKDEIALRPWDELSKETQDKFKKYINEIYK